MWAFAHLSQLRWRIAVRSRPWWGRQACRWASLRWFLTVCAEILWLSKLYVAAAVRVAGLRRSWRWRCWMWRFWAGVVTRGLRLWGRLDVLPNSMKSPWRLLIVEKLTLNSWQKLWWTFLQTASQLHASSKHATSVALHCVIKLHILEWPFIVACLRHTCAIIILSKNYTESCWIQEKNNCMFFMLYGILKDRSTNIIIFLSFPEFIDTFIFIFRNRTRQILKGQWKFVSASCYFACSIIR